MTNKESTMNAHDAIAYKYYEEYKNDISDLEYIDTFLKTCKHKILDLGCGMGHYAKYMSSKGFKVVGIDFSKEMLKIAKAHDDKCNFIEADICQLPEYLDRDFDGVVIAYVLQHLSKDEARICLQKLNKFLSVGAKILIFFREGNRVLEETEPFDASYSYVIKEYTQDEITSLLEECGYKVNNVEQKPFVYDEKSLCQKTLILYATKTL